MEMYKGYSGSSGRSSSFLSAFIEQTKVIDIWYPEVISDNIITILREHNSWTKKVDHNFLISTVIKMNVEHG